MTTLVYCNAFCHDSHSHSILNRIFNMKTVNSSQPQHHDAEYTNPQKKNGGKGAQTPKYTAMYPHNL